jgi:hypothetical protein
MISIGDQKYFGLDTAPSYKNSRWKQHCKEANKNNPKQKIHQKMKEVGIDNCVYTIVKDGFDSIGALALAEIDFIKKNKTFENGLNSSRGGDGLGKHGLNKLSDEEIKKIKEKLSESMSEYNLNYKWANKSIEERKRLTSHLHSQEIYQKKSETLKKYYKANPDEKKKRSLAIKNWQEKNKQLLRERNKISSLIAAEKNSKKLLVTTKNGETFECKSKSEFKRLTGQWANTVINKTKKGLYHNGYKASEI